MGKYGACKRDLAYDNCRIPWETAQLRYHNPRFGNLVEEAIGAPRVVRAFLLAGICLECSTARVFHASRVCLVALLLCA